MPTPLRRRIPAVLACTAMLAASVPAGAQLFWSPPNLSGAPVTGAEPGLALPNASPVEMQAALVWHLRAALNVAALQCDFEPTLLTTTNYNGMINHHRAELAGSFKTLGDYFKKRDGAVAGQKQFDQYGTRVYSSYSAVQAQIDFCQVAGRVGRDAIFAPRGNLYKVAQEHLGELRAALVAKGDTVYGNPAYGFTAKLPPLDKKCWKKGELVKKCVPLWEKERG